MRQDFQERIGRIEELVHKLESSADPALRQSAREFAESLMELHGAALERILEIVSAGDRIPALAADPLVGSLLVLYGLHPESFDTRVRRGLEKARILLRKEGAHFEELAIGDGTVRLKLVGAPSEDLHGAVRAAVLETAPDAVEIVITGITRESGFVPLQSIRAAGFP